MEQVEVCNSWEEFDENSKLLEQQLEKLKLQKGFASPIQPELQSQLPESPTSAATDSSSPPKMKVLKRQVPSSSRGGTINGVVHIPVSTNEIVTEIQDDSIRTQYVPPEPRISILSRPKKSSPSKTRESQSKSKNQQPVKTLEQREQEYAEARRRIFGDALEDESSKAESETET